MGKLIIDMTRFKEKADITFFLKLCTLGGSCAEKEFLLHLDNRNEPPYFECPYCKYANKNMLRILIKVTKEDQINNFPQPIFRYNSPKVVDPDKN